MWRSSSIGLASDHCPHALALMRAGTPYDRRHYAVGVAAHAVLEQLGRESTLVGGYILDRDKCREIAEAVASRLIAEGRSFDGRPEPPLSADAVAQGVALALEYQAALPLGPGARYEQLLAVDREFRPVEPDDQGAWLCAQVDAVEVVYPGILDDQATPAVRVTDYKTGWADESELDTLQRMIQAVIAWAHYGEDGLDLELEVVSVRRRTNYRRRLSMDEHSDRQALEDMRAAIRAAIAGLEAAGDRPNPGGGCMGCPFLGRCEAAAELLSATDPLGDLPELADRYAIYAAELARLRGLLEEAAENEPIIATDGRSVGWIYSEQREPSPDAPMAIAEAWAARAAHGRPAAERDVAIAASLPALVQALRPGITGVRGVADVLFHKDLSDFKQRRASAVEGWTVAKVARKWGIK